MDQLMTSINSIKSRIISLFSSASAMIGACGGICGAACGTGCCGGLAIPLFGFLGLSSSAVHFFEKLKPVFLLITIMSLAYAFYKAYQPKPAVSFDADCDTPNSCCVPEKQTFIQSKSFLWAITILCAIMWLYPYVDNIIPKTIEKSGLSSQRPCSVPCDSQSPKIRQ
jgi:mercuric ion transport protein